MEYPFFFDAFLMKIDENGNKLFFKTWNGSYWEMVRGMVVIGNYIYVGGHLQGRDNTDKVGVFLLKYDEYGNLLWNITWYCNGTYESERVGINGMTTDGNYIYLAGSFGGELNAATLFLVKFDQDGHQIWNVTRGWNRTSDKVAIAADSNSVYLTMISPPPFGVVRIFKYDSNGNFVWSSNWGYGKEFPSAIASYNNSIYITGDSRTRCPQQPCYGHHFLIKYDPNGTLLWERGTNYDGYYPPPHVITVSQGVIYLTGNDGFLLEYDESGNLISANFPFQDNKIRVAEGMIVLKNYIYLIGTPGFICKIGNIPKIVETLPPSGAEQIPLNTNITISFDQPMDKLSVEGALTSVPAINSTISWSSDLKQMIIHPATLLLPNTSYQITINASACSSRGIPLMSNYILRFTTQPVPPVIILTSPLNGLHDVPVTTTILIRFSKPMNRSSVENAISIRPQTTMLRFEWDTKSTEVRVFAGLDYSTRYQVILSPSARDIEGVSLSSGYSFEFTTESEPESSPEQATGYLMLSALILTITIIWVIILSLITMERKLSGKKSYPSLEKKK